MAQRHKTYLLTYLGGALDSVQLKDGGLKSVEREEYELWGTKFPKGKAQETKREDLAKKALALGCFDVEEKAEVAPKAKKTKDDEPKK